MKPLIVGNWKMHGLAAQLADIDTIGVAAHRQSMVDVLMCVPATLLSRAAEMAAGRISLGGQDCSVEDTGACTGDISAEMLKDAGAKYVILGHSERRRWHGETDTIVAAKATSALRSDLSTIICIGESESQRQRGDALAVCGEQIKGSLPAQIASSSSVAVAYEPLWAVGSGRAPDADQIIEMHRHIRASLMTLLDTKGAGIRILYGGSIGTDNAEAVLALENVNGLLIGSASLVTADFAAIVNCSRPDTAPISVLRDVTA